MIKFEPPQRGLLARLRRFFRFYRRDWRAELDVRDKRIRLEIGRAMLRAGAIRDPAIRAELEEFLNRLEGRLNEMEAIGIQEQRAHSKNV